MTIAGNYAPQFDTGNAVTTAFGINFPFFAKSDVEVVLYDTVALALVSPQPVLNGAGTYDYTITGAPDDITGEYPNGTLTFNNAPLANHLVVRARITPATQNVQLKSNANFPAESVEAALDRVSMVAQQNSYLLSRTLRQPDQDIDPLSALPDKDARKGLVLGFDVVTGDTTVHDPMAVSAQNSAAAAAASAAQAAASAAAAGTNLWSRPVSSIVASEPVGPAIGTRVLLNETNPTHANQVAEYFIDGWHYSGAPKDEQILTTPSGVYSYSQGASKWSAGVSVAENPAVTLMSTNTTGGNIRGMIATASINQNNGRMYGSLITTQDTPGNTNNHIVGWEVNAYTENNAANVNSLFGYVAGLKAKQNAVYSGFGLRAELADPVNYPGQWNWGFGTDHGAAARAFQAGQATAGNVSCNSQGIFLYSNNGATQFEGEFFQGPDGTMILTPSASGSRQVKIDYYLNVGNSVRIGTSTFRDILTVNGGMSPLSDNTSDIGQASFQWRNLYAKGFIKSGAFTVATLPSPSASGAGARAFVTDANANTFLTAAAGGGANNVPVVSDGTTWKIG